MKTLLPMVLTDLRVLPSTTTRATLSVGIAEKSMVVVNVAASSTASYWDRCPSRIAAYPSYHHTRVISLESYNPPNYVSMILVCSRRSEFRLRRRHGLGPGTRCPITHNSLPASLPSASITWVRFQGSTRMRPLSRVAAQLPLLLFTCGSRLNNFSSGESNQCLGKAVDPFGGPLTSPSHFIKGLSIPISTVQVQIVGHVELILNVPQRRMKRGGPTPMVWGLVGRCSYEEVARAQNLSSLVHS